MLLKHFIDFSIWYRKKPNENYSWKVRLELWEKYYRKQAALRILKKFVRKSTEICADCRYINWKKNPLKIGQTGENNFYRVQACDKEPYYYTDTLCCEKIICYPDCRFYIRCYLCDAGIKHTPLHQASDVGWNPTEGEKQINIKCPLCQEVNIKKLTWNNEEHDDLNIGKTIRF